MASSSVQYQKALQSAASVFASFSQAVLVRSPDSINRAETQEIKLMDRIGLKLSWIVLLGSKPNKAELNTLVLDKFPACAASGPLIALNETTLQGENMRKSSKCNNEPMTMIEVAVDDQESKDEEEEAEEEAVSDDFRLTLEQFEQLMVPRLLKQDPADVLRMTWEAFDRRCVGMLSKEDVLAAFAQVAPHIHQTTVLDDVFAELDVDLDGRMSFSEFQAGF